MDVRILCGSRLFLSELVRVKDKFQLTIPRDIRMAAAFLAGDYLEISTVAEGILMRPRRVVAYNELFDAFVEPIPISRSMLVRAAELRATVRTLRTPDAIRLATAEHLGARWYVTGDADIPDMATMTKRLADRRALIGAVSGTGKIVRQALEDAGNHW